MGDLGRGRENFEGRRNEGGLYDGLRGVCKGDGTVSGDFALFAIAKLKKMVNIRMFGKVKNQF